jgi:hypothetical protein
MNLYSIVKFLHVSADMGIFVGIGAQLLSLAALRRATSVAQARAIAWLITTTDLVAVISALATIAAGLYMTLAVWGFQHGWITVTLGSLIVLLLPLIRGVIEPRMRAIVATAREAPDGPLPEALARLIHDPILGMTLQTEAAVVFGIVFLMIIKPSLAGSIIAMAAALALGLASGLPFWVPFRRQSKIDL